jgi:hypothetical protein
MLSRNGSGCFDVVESQTGSGKEKVLNAGGRTDVVIKIVRRGGVRSNVTDVCTYGEIPGRGWLFLGRAWFHQLLLSLRQCPLSETDTVEIER